VVETVVNVDTNDGNLNAPASEESELAATIAELETTLETTLETGEEATVETGAARFPAQNAAAKVGTQQPQSHSRGNSRLPKKLWKWPLNPQKMEEPT